MSRIDAAGRGWKRSRVLVEGFQRRYVVAQLAWFAVLLVVFAVGLFGPLAWTLLRNPANAEVAAESFLTLHRVVWPLLLVVFAGAAFISVRMSHRIAGPLYRFRRTFGEVARGNLALRVRLRDRDYLTEEAAAFDAMVAELRERVTRVSDALRETTACAEKLAERGDVETASDIERLTRSLHAAGEAVAEFTLTAPAPSAEGAGTTAADVASVVAPAPAGSSTVRDRGFTLVEILVVSAIVTILAGIGMPVYSSALQSARVTRAIGDIRALGKEMMVSSLTQGCLPSLAEMGQADRKDPWGNPYVLSVFRVGSGRRATCAACSGTCVGVGQARKDPSRNQLNVDYDLYSTGRDGQTATNLNNRRSRDDVVRGRNGGFVGLASEY